MNQHRTSDPILVLCKLHKNGDHDDNNEATKGTNEIPSNSFCGLKHLK